MRHRFLALLAGATLCVGARAAEIKIPELPPAVTKPVPESIEDLKAFQKQTRAVLDHPDPREAP